MFCMLWHTELYGTTICHSAWKGGTLLLKGAKAPLCISR